MIEQFERFTGGPFVRTSDQMYASLSSKGTLVLNRRLYEAFGVPEAVVLSFDRKNSIIALDTAHRSLKEAFPVIRKDGYWYIRTSPFCKHFGIRIDKTVQFQYPKIDDTGRLRLDLTQTISVAHRRPRAQRRRSS